MIGLVLAAGLGKRLRPLTLRKPKPLLKVLNTTLLEIALNDLARLKRKGYLSEIWVNLHYMPELMEMSIERLEVELSTEIRTLFEPKLLDTGGTVKKLLSLYPNSDIITRNCDVLLSYPLERLVELHSKLDKDTLGILLGFVPSTEIGNYLYPPNLVFDNSCKLIDIGSQNSQTFKGKSNTCHFCGVYTLRSRALELMPDRDEFSILEVFRRAPEKFRIITYRGWFADMGRFKSLLTVSTLSLNFKVI